LRVRRERGVTLVELVVALGLLAMVMTAAGRLLLVQKRFYRELGQRADLGDNLRAGVEILTADLWGVDARDGDLLAIGADSVRLRAERQFGVVCGTESTSLLLWKSLTFGIRDLAPGDSILVYAGPDSLWTAGAVVSGPVDVSCPDSTPGERVGVALSGPSGPSGPSLVAGTPVRGYEVVTYRSYRAADGAYYLGLRDAGALQPLVGPLAPAGLLLTFFDSVGAVTGSARDVSAIGIRLRAWSAEPVSRRGVTAVLDDSVVSLVTLRNNRHD
jgi:prepilin-type N-terminal cleavage/methylation domain-containing protein